MLPTVAIFPVTYLGVALGHIPGLALDRTGIALLGAIAMIVAGAVTLPQAVGHVDLPTIILLYALMVVSAQLRLGGFYTFTAFRISHLLVRPRFFLLVSIANLIVIEQASIFGVEISFREHARVGIPVTLFSLAVLGLWIYV